MKQTISYFPFFCSCTLVSFLFCTRKKETSRRSVFTNGKLQRQQKMENVQCLLYKYFSYVSTLLTIPSCFFHRFVFLPSTLLLLMGICNQMTETSTSSNPVLPLKKRKRPVDDTTDSLLPQKRLHFQGIQNTKEQLNIIVTVTGALRYTLTTRGFGQELSNLLLKPPWLTIAHPSSSEALMLIVTGTSL